MRNANKQITNSDQGGQGSFRPIFCKIFSDWVSPHLCEIRRKELSAQGTFSCEDCTFAQGETALASI